MRKPRLPLMATLTGTLLGVPAGPFGEQSEHAPADPFPTSTVVADFGHADRHIEFAADGTCRWVALDGSWARSCTCAANGSSPR